MSSLTKKKCKPCEGDVAPFTPEQVMHAITETPEWHAVPDASVIARTFVFKNFTQAIDFINKVAKVAEAENHHPDIFLHNYRSVTISLTTHAIGGLSENDFIVAAKIDALL